MRGKQGWISRGQKKQLGASDTSQLIEVASYIRKKYKVKVKREWYILFNDFGILGCLESLKRREVDYSIIIKNPDLLWVDKYGMWIVEIDGAVHDRKVKKTNERNKLFIKNHINLIVVNLADLKELNINIYDYIDDRILELIRG